MRLAQPRIAPLRDNELTAEQKTTLEPIAARGHVLNIFGTLAREPWALKGFLAWGEYVLSRRNGLPPREREMVVLRVGYLCRSGYEWTRHTRIGLECGLTDAEVERIKAGAGAAGWTKAETALLRAVDELHADQFISEPTWAALANHFTDKQRMDLVFTVGQYTQVSMMLNTFGVQLDEGQTLDPDLKAY